MDLVCGCKEFEEPVSDTQIFSECKCILDGKNIELDKIEIWQE